MLPTFDKSLATLDDIRREVRWRNPDAPVIVIDNVAESILKQRAVEARGPVSPERSCRT
jgi:hypothetical protein